MPAPGDYNNTMPAPGDYNNTMPAQGDYNRNDYGPPQGRNGLNCRRRTENLLDLPREEEVFEALVEGMGEIGRAFFRSAEERPNRVKNFERDIQQDILRPIQGLARDVSVSTDGLPTAGQIRETMGGVIRGVMYGVLMNQRDVKDGARELTCELNMMADEAMRGIKEGFKELGVELREPREWKDVQAMLV